LPRAERKLPKGFWQKRKAERQKPNKERQKFYKVWQEYKAEWIATTFCKVSQ